MSLLTIENITKSFFHRTVLDRVSLRIQEGDRLGFIGPNGAGKTTLFKIINGEEIPEQGQVVKPGNVIIGYLSQHIDDANVLESTALRNRELEDLEDRMHRLEALMGSFSDHLSLEYRTITTDYATLTAKYESLDGYAYERMMKETLQGLGLARDALSRPLTSLSGGEKMRVALARILLVRPDILLLDEPTNHLDVNAMEWLEEYLAKFKGAMILISHDRYFLDKVTNQTAELDDGKLSIRPGNYSKYMNQKSIEQDFAKKELLRIEKELERQTQVKQTMLSHRNMSGYHAREKVVSKLSDDLIQAKTNASHSLSKKMNFKLMPRDITGDPKRLLIEAEKVSKSFNARVIFSDVSFQLGACDKAVLVGPNGCGKSTLLSIVLGKITEFDGTIRLSSRLRYAHMGQHVVFTEEDHTPLMEFIFRADCTEGQARGILARFGFRDVDCMKKISVLSGGERSRLYLACLLQEMPDILLLDEPTNHLDIPSREILENALNDFNGAILAVSHDRYFIDKCAKKVWGFMNGTLQVFDSYEQYRLLEKRAKSASPGAAVNLTSSLEEASDGVQVFASDNESPLKQRQNKAEERRQVALRRDRIRCVEQQISEYENLKASMESGFTSTTASTDYEAYAALLAQIDQCYNSYMMLLDEDSNT